jgi:hypothetical protein
MLKKDKKYCFETLSIHTKGKKIPVSFVIFGRYIPSFWTANLEFADKEFVLAVNSL